MNSPNFKFLKVVFVALLLVLSTSCSDDDGPVASITVNEGPSGDIGGDFTGNGGNAARTISWSNSLATADYNADITSSAVGIFQMVVVDAEGNTVLDRSLNGDVEPDSFSGVTAAGTPGDWTVTITITNFNGDGSYSLSEGN
ncbi:hypothetical protein [Spongiivirga citrea]|uniref:Uncharacterized protein n=1 Tax=Spongiivirga citrea TaxID=1481457 RepID=A0A6M0CE13_9FLAO|nr:hypothetical protein [Spongiivirga citrea]NER16078.1 hypothetical protein [Spongiivirga citrea]